MAIRFFFHEVSVNLSKRRLLKGYLTALFSHEKVPLAELTYVFCSDDYLLHINQQFLQHDTYTDIVTFSLSPIDEPVVGEVYISIDRVKDNAQKFGVTVEKELLRVIFHGALHLCGYKDKKSADQLVMRQKETEYITGFEGYVPRGT